MTSEKNIEELITDESCREAIEEVQAEKYDGKVFTITLEDKRDGTKEVVEADYACLLVHVGDSSNAEDEICGMHAYEWCAAPNKVRVAAAAAFEKLSKEMKKKLLSEILTGYFGGENDDE